jgi:hexosaminidase
LGNNKRDKLFKIIPKPNVIIPKANDFIMSRDTIIVVSEKLNTLAIYLQDFLIKECDLELKLICDEKYKYKHNSVILWLDEFSNEDLEEYHLNINKNKITLNASNERGIFYGIQTILQLIYQSYHESVEKEKEHIKLNCVEIQDSPRFEWRGFMLDEARHFFGKEMVKKVLDIMALLKLNTFHWHLTDDQGWRIEIKKYSRLIEIGSRRRGTNVNKSKLFVNSSINDHETDGIPVIGYYTQEEIKEIITYAAQRYITIIPEIDLPGHSMALLASYPELSCTGGPFEVGTRFGIYRDVLCIGKELVFQYVEGILSEVIELFPSDYVHIGGDEAPRTRWKKCPDCKARIAQESIENVDNLQLYFTNRFSQFLLAHGKRVVSWNETINEDLNTEVYCQNWNVSQDEILNELKKGRKVIMSEIKSTYFDYPYKLNSLQHVYQYDPILETLSENFRQNVIGIEACLWTEHIKTREKLEYLLFPRLFAIAEIGWTEKNNMNYLEFETRMSILFKQFEREGINYALKEEYEGHSTERVEKYFKST